MNVAVIKVTNAPPGLYIRMVNGPARVRIHINPSKWNANGSSVNNNSSINTKDMDK